MKLAPPLPYLGDDLLLLAELEQALAACKTPVLLRASEREKLTRLEHFGTDRGGYPGERAWRGGMHRGRKLLHADVILATTADDIRRGAEEPSYPTSFKKLPGIAEPLLLIYDTRALEPVGEREWAFRPGVDRCASLLQVFPIDKIDMPRGWMGSAEGLAYRALVRRAGPRVVEVGCWLGRSTSYVARATSQLICVDHFSGSTDRYHDAYHETLASTDVRGAFERHMRHLGAEVELMAMDSPLAARRFADGSLDLVFLDGSHDEDAVRKDIAAWWPKLRPGGILAGHDHDEEHPGVARAVAHLDPVVGPGTLYHAVVR